MKAERIQIVRLVDEAIVSGARQSRCAKVVGIDERTLQRWRANELGEDGRRGPLTEPANKLSASERALIVEIADCEEFRELSPKQIVPLLADRGQYVGSESSFYRVLGEEQQMAHREPSNAATRARPRQHVADGPGQCWSWDITYLRSPVRGAFYYLYMIVDLWSRKIVGWEVHEEESMELSSRLVDRLAAREGVDVRGLVLHSDNGGPMKGATMLATLDSLGIVASFSRPRVSNDNPYSEALFRTLKYRPQYPQRPFTSITEARTWVAWFVQWYNQEHLHSAIGFVTPQQRHEHADIEILQGRERVYEEARRRNPRRWSGKVRNWDRIERVWLNPEPKKQPAEQTMAQAA